MNLIKNKLLFLILTIGLVIRIALNNIIYSKDAESFVFWGKYLQDHSIASLYEFLPGGFTPLPPLYYYISRFLGKTVSFLNLWQNEWATYLIFKQKMGNPPCSLLLSSSCDYLQYRRIWTN